MPHRQGGGLANRPAGRYKGSALGGEGNTGAAAAGGRAITQCRGFRVIDIKGQRVALYARHSTQLQDRSVPAQLDLAREFARRHGATVVEEFADEGISGAVLQDRPGIMALIKAAAHGDFQAVLIEDLSRVSRDQADVATIYKLLFYHGVELVSVTEGPINELWVGFKGTMNAIYLKDLSYKTRRGQRAAVDNGGIPGGDRYGYDVVPTTGAGGRRAINEDEAAVVRRIFAEVAAGRPYREVARALNADGIPSPKGSRWHASTLVGDRARGRGILRNPIYRGRLEFGREKSVRNPVTGRRERHRQPESEWKIVDVPDLAIVPPEQWFAVKAIIDAKRPGRTASKRPRRPKKTVRYITSGRIWCADCGARVTTLTTAYLACQTHRTTQTCRQRHTFRRPDVIAELTRILASPDHAASVHAAVSAEAEIRRTRATRLSNDLGAFERALAAMRRAATALVRTAGTATDSRRAIQDLAIPQSEFRALATRLAIARDTLALLAPRMSVDAIAATAHARIATAARRHAGEDHGSDSQHSRLLQEVIERITVAWRGGGRSHLVVTVTLSPAAVYVIGVEELRRQDDHGAAPVAAPSPA